MSEAKATTHDMEGDLLLTSQGRLNYHSSQTSQPQNQATKRLDTTNIQQDKASRNPRQFLGLHATNFLPTFEMRDHGHAPCWKKVALSQKAQVVATAL
jgi:hypothetical protein